MTAPQLNADTAAAFARARTLSVYSAPADNAWHETKAQVTTDESVTIYGVDNGWVLVGYSIGNGKKGRIGYVETSTLAEPEKVQPLVFGTATAVLAKDTRATDDPMHSGNTKITLKANTTVTVLALLDKWAYVETEVNGKPCRIFVRQTAITNK